MNLVFDQSSPVQFVSEFRGGPLSHPSLEASHCMGSVIMSGTNTQQSLLPRGVAPNGWLLLLMGDFSATSSDLAYSYKWDYNQRTNKKNIGGPSSSLLCYQNRWNLVGLGCFIWLLFAIQSLIRLTFVIIKKFYAQHLLICLGTGVLDVWPCRQWLGRRQKAKKP